MTERDARAQTEQAPMSRAARMNSRRGTVLTLPNSGDEILVRRAGIPYLLEFGMLPDTLTPIVNSMISDAEGRNAEEIAAKVQTAVDAKPALERVAMIAQLYNFTLKACGIDPLFVDTVQDPEREVALGDVDFRDKEFVFMWAQGGPADAAAFRTQQERALAAVSESEDVQPAAQRATRRRS